MGKAGVSTGRRQKATADDSIICYARSLQDKMQQQQQQQVSGNCHAEYVHLVCKGQACKSALTRNALRIAIAPVFAKPVDLSYDLTESARHVS